MKVEVVTCDRCGERLEADSDLSTMSVKLPPGRNGRTRDRLDSVELCPVCVVDLASWIGTPPVEPSTAT
jgi:hypothetical protein